MRDLHNNNVYKTALEAQSLAATANGEIVDTAGYDGVELVINVGNFAFTTSNKISIKLQAGDKSSGSDMADIDGFYLLGKNIVLDNANDKQSCFKQGYFGGKRYIRAVFTIGGTVNAPMSATFQLRPIHLPAKEQDATN